MAGILPYRLSAPLPASQPEPGAGAVVGRGVGPVPAQTSTGGRIGARQLRVSPAPQPRFQCAWTPAWPPANAASTTIIAGRNGVQSVAANQDGNVIGGSKCASELHVPVAVDFKCAARMAWMRMYVRRGREALMCMREVSRSQQEEMSRNMYKRRTADECQ